MSAVLVCHDEEIDEVIVSAQKTSLVRPRGVKGTVSLCWPEGNWPKWPGTGKSGSRVRSGPYAVASN